jgi:hypothetical protein
MVKVLEKAFLQSPQRNSYWGMATSKLMKRNARILDPLIEEFNTWVRSRILRGRAHWNWRRMRAKWVYESASRASCHKRCAQGTESSVTTLGGGVQQGEFLSWNTNPFGAATEWVVEAVEMLDLNTDGAGNAIQEEPGDTGSGERTKRRILRGLGREFFRRFGSRICPLRAGDGACVYFKVVECDGNVRRSRR